MNKKTKLLCVILAVIAAISLISTAAFAIDWNGASSGSSSGSSYASDNFWLTQANNTTACVGYRFSVIDASGQVAKISSKNCIIDIYRNKTAYDYYEKSITKYSKVQLIAQYNSGASNVVFNTNKNTTGCIMQSTLGITLPDPAGMGDWQDVRTNLDSVLKKMGYSKGVFDLGVNCRVLVEPIWLMVLDGYYECLTVSEVCAYGIRNDKLGANSYGGDPDFGVSFGTISGYTNNLWPNSLYTNTGDGLQNSNKTNIWNATRAISNNNGGGYNKYLLGSGAYRKTFAQILTEGYGVGVAFTQTPAGNYTATFALNDSSSAPAYWKGTKERSSKTVQYTYTSKLAAYGNPNLPTRTGYDFVSWKVTGTDADSSWVVGSTYSDSTLKNDTNQWGNVRFEAQWRKQPDQFYNIEYELNGGTFTNGYNYTRIQNKTQVEYVNPPTAKINPTSTTNEFFYFQVDHPVKEGFTFNGWKIDYMTSGTHYCWYNNAKNSELLGSGGTITITEDIYHFSKLRNSAGTVKFTAIWASNEYEIVYNLKGGSFPAGHEPGKMGTADKKNTPGQPKTYSEFAATKWNGPNKDKLQYINPTNAYVNGTDTFDKTGYSFFKYFVVERPTKKDCTFKGWIVSGMDDSVHLYWDSSEKKSSSVYWYYTSIPGQRTTFANLHSGVSANATTKPVITFTAVWEHYADVYYCSLNPKEVTLANGYDFETWKDKQGVERGKIIDSTKQYVSMRISAIDDSLSDNDFRWNEYVALENKVSTEGLHNIIEDFGATRPGYYVDWNDRGDTFSTGFGRLWNAKLNWDGDGEKTETFNDNDKQLTWYDVLPSDREDDFLNGKSTSVNLYITWVPIYQITCHWMGGTIEQDRRPTSHTGYTSGNYVFYQKTGLNFSKTSTVDTTITDGVLKNEDNSILWGIDVPTKKDYIFDGYYTGQNGTGTKVVDKNGFIEVDCNFFKQNTVIYANWIPTITLYFCSDGAAGTSEQFEYGKNYLPSWSSYKLNYFNDAKDRVKFCYDDDSYFKVVIPAIGNSSADLENTLNMSMNSLLGYEPSEYRVDKTSISRYGYKYYSDDKGYYWCSKLTWETGKDAKYRYFASSDTDVKVNKFLTDKEIESFKKGVSQNRNLYVRWAEDPTAYYAYFDIDGGTWNIQESLLKKNTTIGTTGSYTLIADVYEENGLIYYFNYNLLEDILGYVNCGMTEYTFSQLLRAPGIGLPTKDGYTFAGWKVVNTSTNRAKSNWDIGAVYTDNELAGMSGKIGDVHFQAQWTPNNYTATFDVNGGQWTMFDSPMKSFGKNAEVRAWYETEETVAGSAPVMHIGVDLGGHGGSTFFMPVSAIANGEVVLSEWTDYYGNTVILKHALADGSYVYSLYGHLACEDNQTDENYNHASTAPYVSVGQTVRQGDVIGHAGKTYGSKGYATGSHLHFEIRIGSMWGQTVDPSLYVDFSVHSQLSNRDFDIISKGYTVTDVLNAPGLAEPTRTGYVFSGWKVTGFEVDSNWTSKTYPTNGLENANGKYGDVQFEAQWTPANYSITYKWVLPNGSIGGTYSLTPNTYTVDAAETLPSVPNPDAAKYTLADSKWHTDQNCSSPAVTSIPAGSTGDKVFYTKVAYRVYNIQYYLDGSLVKSDTYTYGTGKSPLYSLAAATGKTNAPSANATWYTSTAKTTTATSIGATETGDKNFYKYSSGNTYTITYRWRDDDSVISTDSYTYGTARDLMVVPSVDHYTVTNQGTRTWFTGKTGTATVTKISATDTGNKTFYAEKTLTQYKATFKTNSGKWDSDSTTANKLISYTYGTAINITDSDTVSRSGYRFLGWKVTASSGNWIVNDTLYTNAQIRSHTNKYGDVTFTAQWEQQYTATFRPNGGTWNDSTTANKSVTYSPTIKIKVPGTVSRNYYHFAGWKVLSSVGTWTKDDVFTADEIEAKTGMTGNVTFVAQWTPYTYTVRFHANGGTGTMADQKFTYDVAQNLRSLAFAPATGYHLVSGYVWNTKADGTGSKYRDGQSVKNLVSTDNGYIDLYAQWEINTSTLKVVPNGGSWNGTAATSTLTKAYNTTIDIPVPTRNGYTFKGWTKSTPFYGTISSLTEKATYKFGADNGVTSTITANWEEIQDEQYTATFVPNGGKWTTGTSTGNRTAYYTVKTAISVPGTLNRNGYEFEGWKVTASNGTWKVGAQYTTEQIQSKIGETGNVTFTAVWTPVSYIANFELGDATAAWTDNHNDRAPRTVNYTITTGVTVPGSVYIVSITGSVRPYHQEFSHWEVTEAEGNWTVGKKYYTNAEIEALDNMYGNVTFTAMYKDVPNNFTATFKLDGGKWNNGTTTNVTTNYTVEDILHAPYNMVNPTKEGYTFAGWKQTVPGNSTSIGNWPINKTYANGLLEDKSGFYGNPIFVAQWDDGIVRKDYTASFDYNGGKVSANDPDNQKVVVDVVYNNYDNDATHIYTPLVAPGNPIAPTGYKFTGWKITKSNGNWIVNNDIWSKTQIDNHKTDSNGKKMWGDVTFVAQYEPIHYTVRFNPNGGTPDEQKTQEFTYDDIQPLDPNPYTKPGYTFDPEDCWNTKPDGSGDSFTDEHWILNLTPIDGDVIDLYVQWKPIEYDVRYNGNGNTNNVETPTQHFVYDQGKNMIPNPFVRVFNVTCVYNDGTTSDEIRPATATFNGWAKTANGNVVYSDKQYVKNLTTTNGAIVDVYAKWTDGSIILPNPTKPGYELDGWYPTNDPNPDPDDKIGNGGDPYTPDEDITIYAHWKPIEYDVRYNGNGNTNDVGTPTQHFIYDQGQNLNPNPFVRVFNVTCVYNDGTTSDVVKPATATFLGWAKTPTGNKVYNDKQYVINLTTTKNDVIDVYAKWQDGTIILPNPTKPGYEFDGWFPTDDPNPDPDDKIGDPGDPFTPSEDTTIYGHWTPIEYDIKFHPNGGTPNEDTTQHFIYDQGQNLNENPYSKPGYKFDGWNTKPDGTGTPYTDKQYVINLTTVKNDVIDLYAQWTPIEYIIRFDPNGGTGTMEDLPMVYDTEKPLTPISFTRDGYDYGEPVWNTKPDGSGISYTNEQIVKNLTVVDGEVIVLYAQWVNTKPLVLVPIAQNADYKEGTEVITSYHLINETGRDRIPSDNVTLTFRIYNGETLIDTITINNAIVPDNEQNLYYFKWTVPTGIDTNKIRIVSDITESGRTYGEETAEFDTCAFVASVTPDIEYDFASPAWFNAIPDVPEGESAESVSWTVWTYSNGSFSKVTYGLTLNANYVVTPDENANKWDKNGITYTRSAYGLNFEFGGDVASLDGTVMATSDMYTAVQGANAYVPEFLYSAEYEKYRTLEMVDDKLVLCEDEYGDRSHFIPLWYPNSLQDNGTYKYYVVFGQLTDFWTPMGMLHASGAANPIGIEGTVYDDWQLG